MEDRTLLSASPTISGIVDATSARIPVITWNVADSAGFAAADVKMTVDGAAVLVGTVTPSPATNADFWGLLEPSDFSLGTHKYVITATDANGVWQNASGTYSVAYTIKGVAPTISLGNVTSTMFNWNVSAPPHSGVGIQSSAVTINGVSQKVDGPASSILNAVGQTTQAGYTATPAAMAPGSTIVITATLTNGVTTTYNTTFGVGGIGPYIAQLDTASTPTIPAIVWQVHTLFANNGPIASCSMTVDGEAATVPTFTGSDMSDYWGLLSPTLSAGNHSFVITTAAANGTTTTYSSTFAVVAQSPAISSVVVATSADTPVITWNAQATAGIKSTAITLDGVSLAVCGPYGGSTNANYAGLLGNLSGNHTYTYTIVVTDNDGTSVTWSGAFLMS